MRLGKGIRVRTIVGFLVSLALVLAFASVAMAGPRDDQYSNGVTQVTSKPKSVTGVSGAKTTQNAPTVVKAAKGALPFTGFQLGITLLIGTGLVGAGVLVRRMGRSRDTDL